MLYDHGARRRSYELLAEVMDVTPQPAKDRVGGVV